MACLLHHTGVFMSLTPPMSLSAAFALAVFDDMVMFG